ncbi:MAG: PD-(D/E)XK nuclease family protein [Acidimicrobiales bacterium]
MIRDVHTVAFGRNATEALAGAIVRAKHAGPLSPVTVVVPSNFAGLSLRRLLGGGALGAPGLANVGFLTPYQVAQRLAPPSLRGLRPVTNPVLGAAVRRALADDPGPFAEVASHPATEASVATLYGELSQVSAATLDALEESGGISATAVALHRRVARHLTGFYGEPELARAVVSRPDLVAAAAPLGHLVWHLPEPTSPTLDTVVAELATALDTTVIVGLTGVADADAAVLELCERSAIPMPASVEVPASPTASAVVSVPDPDEEARVAVRRVLELAESGVSLDRVAIYYPRSDPYVGALEHHLAEAGLPANGPSRERLADSVAGRTLLGALELPAQRWRRDRVMALVASAPVRAGPDHARPGAWEQLSRTAGVVQGLDDWQRKLSARQAHLTQRIETAQGPDLDRVPRLVAERDELDALATFVSGLAERVEAVTSATGWHRTCVAARDLLTHLLGAEHRRQRWPEAEVDAAARVDDALTRLALLDEIEPSPSHEVFLRALAGELEAGRGRTGRFGDGVAYGPLASAPGQDLDAVVVLGLAEGICPSPRRDDSLLPDAVRARARPGELPLRSQRLHHDHRALLAALASAPEGARTLVHPRGSLRNGSTNLPSRWLLDTVSVLAGTRVYSTEFASLGPPVVQVVGSPAAAIRAARVPLSVLEHDQRDLARTVDAGGDPLAHPAVDHEVGRGLRCLLGRRSHEFTEWDGNLAEAPVPIPSPTRDGALLSPTGLEEWAACGFRYFLSHALGLRDRDDPERIREIDPRDRGSAVHTALERFFAEVIEAGSPHPDTPWSPAQRERLGQIAAEVFDDYESQGRTGRPILWRLERERLHALLDGFLTADDQRRAAWRSRPRSVELPFGLDDADPVVLGLSDGRTLRFRGKADRVDRTEDGRWVVIDYKTGKGTRFRGLDDDPFLSGTTLQLGLYAEAARQRLGGLDASAYYWMVDEAARYATFGYAWTPERRDRFLDLVGAMVEGIEAGVFPATPGEYDHFRRTHDACAYCDFDRVCPVDRGERAEAKVDAPELAVRRRLVPLAAESAESDSADGADPAEVGR